MVRWLVLAAWLGACGGEDIYASCDEAADCGEIAPDSAEPECVPKENWGFCTWSCTEDSHCSEDGDEDYDFVCASFEEQTGKFCFPSCREEGTEEEEVCPDGYECRSTGGGSENRRVCFPNDSI